MTISMFDASVPVFRQMMGTLAIVLDKGERYAASHGLAPDALLHASLYPDMYDFVRQVQMASDFAKAVPARLAAIDAPSFPDTETSFADLKERVRKTVEFLSTISRDQIEGSEDREIVVRAGTPREKTYLGMPYLLHHGLPHFYFHVTAAYAILRNQGVEIGKTDYMGKL